MAWNPAAGPPPGTPTPPESTPPSNASTASSLHSDQPQPQPIVPRPPPLEPNLTKKQLAQERKERNKAVASQSGGPKKWLKILSIVEAVMGLLWLITGLVTIVTCTEGYLYVNLALFMSVVPMVVGPVKLICLLERPYSFFLTLTFLLQGLCALTAVGAAVFSVLGILCELEASSFCYSLRPGFCSSVGKSYDTNVPNLVSCIVALTAAVVELVISAVSCYLLYRVKQLASSSVHTKSAERPVDQSAPPPVQASPVFTPPPAYPAPTAASVAPASPVPSAPPAPVTAATQSTDGPSVQPGDESITAPPTSAKPAVSLTTPKQQETTKQTGAPPVATATMNFAPMTASGGGPGQLPPININIQNVNQANADTDVKQKKRGKSESSSISASAPPYPESNRTPYPTGPDMMPRAMPYQWGPQQPTYQPPYPSAAPPCPYPTNPPPPYPPTHTVVVELH